MRTIGTFGTGGPKLLLLRERKESTPVAGRF
jgi:hypothetical protein